MSNASPCFTPGALIATDRGWRPVETLTRGDRVVTRDNGLKRISWVGRRDMSYADLAEFPGLQPILIRKGSFGDGLPDRDMLVSPNHRFLTTSPYQADEGLLAARHMMDRHGVARAQVLGVSYLHILLDAHQVILANGIWTESFHPDDATMKALGARTAAEILALYPEIATLGAARRFPPAREIRQSRFEM